MLTPKNRAKPEFESLELWLFRLCLVVALGVSAFLAWSSFKGGGVPGCGPESGCDKVLNSKWAYAFGLPVSVFAIPVYVGLLALIRPQKINWHLVTPLALLVLLSALWFLSVQTFVLRAFCKFCMVAHAAGTVGALLILRKTTLPFPRIGVALASAAAAVAIVATAQMMSGERGPVQIAMGSSTNGSEPAASAPTFTIMEGQFTFDLRKVPVTGPLNAPYKVAKLFDYTCHHCRELHHLLRDFRLQHSNDLAVVSLPMPLDSNCNPNMRSTPAAHRNACEYAKLGLAVFAANPEKFEDYTEWIFAPSQPPELTTARQHAGNLVGAANLAQALTKPFVDEQIKTDIAIFTAALRATKKGQMPQMYFERGASIGAVKDRKDLEQIMVSNLGIGATASPR